jgi:hypothetical protein
MRRELGMTDGDYRGHLQQRFRVVSSRELDDSQAAELIDDLRAAGANGGPRSSARTATGNYAKVLQALWISAWQLGIVENRDDAAMLRFVERQTGLPHTRFLKQSADAAKAIEGLKAWIAREAGVAWPSASQANKLGRSIAELAARAIVRAQVSRLKAFGAWPGDDASPEINQDLADFARVTVGIPGEFQSYGVEQWRRLADALGKRLRPYVKQGAKR